VIVRALVALAARAPGIEAGAGLAMITAGSWLVWSLGVALIVAGVLILAAAVWPSVARGRQ
jgi:uncharacterized membrane protein YecN with MAPEG domain